MLPGLSQLRGRDIVLLALYGVAAVASAFAGYAAGLGARPSRLPVYLPRFSPMSTSCKRPGFSDAAMIDG